VPKPPRRRRSTAPKINVVVSKEQRILAISRVRVGAPWEGAVDGTDVSGNAVEDDHGSKEGDSKEDDYAEDESSETASEEPTVSRGPYRASLSRASLSSGTLRRASTCSSLAEHSYKPSHMARSLTRELNALLRKAVGESGMSRRRRDSNSRHGSHSARTIHCVGAPFLLTTLAHCVLFTGDSRLHSFEALDTMLVPPAARTVHALSRSVHASHCGVRTVPCMLQVGPRSVPDQAGPRARGDPLPPKGI
jgi:hypothetical protein